MKKTIYTSAPLPFQGQKRRFTTAFVTALRELDAKNQIKIVVDLFGGSGLLSHTSKRILPDSKVIYNDFDGYCERLNNIDATNQLIADIRVILDNYPRKTMIDANKRAQILKRIEIEEKRGFVDYITLSASLLFSAKYVVSLEGLAKETLYNNIKLSNYDLADEYLDGLEIVCCDYKSLYQRYKDAPGVLFIVDPPYLSTDTTTYHSDKYWKLRDYLDVLNVLVGTNYIFFTSNKSSLIDLCEWFEDNKSIGNPFADSILNTQRVSINKAASYTDMMLYKFLK